MTSSFFLDGGALGRVEGAFILFLLEFLVELRSGPVDALHQDKGEWTQHVEFVDDDPDLGERRRVVRCLRQRRAHARGECRLAIEADCEEAIRIGQVSEYFRECRGQSRVRRIVEDTVNVMERVKGTTEHDVDERPLLAPVLGDVDTVDTDEDRCVAGFAPFLERLVALAEQELLEPSARDPVPLDDLRQGPVLEIFADRVEEVLVHLPIGIDRGWQNDLRCGVVSDFDARATERELEPMPGDARADSDDPGIVAVSLERRAKTFGKRRVGR